MPRGGVRPGSGRKPLEGDRKTASYHLPKDLIDSIIAESKKQSEVTGRTVSASAIVERWLKEIRAKS